MSRTTPLTIRLPAWIKYVLVDIHGVLTDGQERKRFLEYMSATYLMDYDQHNSLWMNYVPDLDINQKSTADYLKIVNAKFHTQISAEKYFQLFTMHIQINYVLLETLKKLDKYHCICIVSDNVRELHMALNPLFGLPFLRYKKFFSYELGKTKADGMFLPVLQQLKANPAECLFIDDNAKNIEAANSLGIRSLQFISNEQLFTDIKYL